MATYLPSHKPSKLGEQDMLITVDEERQTHKRRSPMDPYHMDPPMLADQ